MVDITEIKENAYCCETESRRRTTAALMLVWLTMHMDAMDLVEDEHEMTQQQELIPDAFDNYSSPMLYTEDEQQEATTNTICTSTKPDEVTPLDDSVYIRKLKWMKHLT